MSAKTLLSALLCTVFSFALLVSYGQDRTITGKVTDSKDGSPVAGATVQPKGTRTGTSTRADGTFSLTVGSGVTTLVITSVGYETQEVSLDGKTNVDVSFVPSAGSNLNEVVVTGYGTAKRKDLTGSIASVQAKDFNKGVATAPDQLIQGKVAGVQILNNNGAPGAGSTIRIRGANSIRGGNNPLFVIDGIPLDYTSVESGFNTGVGNTPGSNPLNFINPADIASIDVMKDASAAAIYGSRGANGVVIITTKRSLSGQPSLDITSSVGIGSVMRRIEVLTGDEYRAALTKYGLTSGNFGSSVDALDELLQTAVIQNYSVAVGGGNENARYRFSTSYQNEEGIIPETGYKKITGNLTSNFKFLDSKKLGLDVRLLASHTTNQLAPVTNDAGFQQSVIGSALQWNPTHALRKPNDSIWVVDPALGATTINPLALLAAWDVYGNTINILGNIQPYYKFNDHLEYRMLYGIVRESGTTRGQIARWLNQQGIEGRGIAGIFNRELTTHQLTHTLNYNGKINPDLSLNALLGYEYRKSDIRGSGMTGQDFDDNGIAYYNQLQAATVNSRGIFAYADPIQYLQSYFGRVAFNFKEKLHLTATVRADGSSKFGENNKYGYFPSFGAAYTLTNEQFIQNLGFFDYLKLRVGWGITGNQEFPGGASLASISITGPGATQFNNYANPDLQWEKVTTTDVGLDFTVWNNRLTGSVEYFKKITSDPLFLVTVPQPGPQGARYWKNLDCEVDNTGLEITLNAAVIRNDNIAWNLGANATFLKNKVTNLGDAVYETGGLHGQGISGATSQRIVNNRPLNVYYLRVWEGIDKATGQSIYADDGYSRFYVGDPNPNTLLGINTDFSYKKWMVIVNMHGAYGHQIYNNTANSVLPIGNLGTRNIDKNILSLPDLPAQSDPITPSTRYMESGNFLKLSNATISYRIGTIGKIFRNAVVQLTGQNLFVITDFTGFDPEVNVDKSVDGIPSYGIEYTPYPTARKFILGVNFSL
jgi:TonB-dependent starch-binding outer membrane protein SusC